MIVTAVPGQKITIEHYDALLSILHEYMAPYDWAGRALVAAMFVAFCIPLYATRNRVAKVAAIWAGGLSAIGVVALSVLSIHEYAMHAPDDVMARVRQDLTDGDIRVISGMAPVTIGDLYELAIDSREAAEEAKEYAEDRAVKERQKRILQGKTDS